MGAVEDRFGVCKLAQKRQFKALRQEPGETGYQFVRRVEDARLKMGSSPEATMDLYFDKLPKELQLELEGLRRAWRVQELTWDQVVWAAKDAM